MRAEVTSVRQKTLLRRWKLPVAALFFFVALTAMNPAHSAATDKCTDVTFIGARGSGEESEDSTKGMGPSVYFMAAHLKGALRDRGVTVGYSHVRYPADSTKELIPSTEEIEALQSYGLGAALALYYVHHVRPYLKSIHTGVTRMIEEVELTDANCPATEIVLGGYSQGAMVIHQAELQLVEEGNGEAMDSISGTLLLGDGDRVPNTDAVLMGGAAASGAGIQARLHAGWLHPEDVAEPRTTVEICAPHDIVCDFSGTAIVYAGRDALLRRNNIHKSYFYERQNLLDGAVDLIARKVG